MQKDRRRRGRQHRQQRDLDITRLRMSLPSVVQKRGVEFQVQQSTGANAEEGKSWICPVCSIDIEPGVVHTVAWDLHRGVNTRRHFHNHCFKIFDGELF
ncbi:hypothetical protein HRU87_02495 [Aquiluna borgnonia]|uniref:Uncharacterized protein n=1 Tax=Aquiluna borgnonia TaxID=2499157 RepID=A0A7D4QFZ5_9MICO|nr:hypothetical protein [Aquiluna borgnonia]QKJ25088.1 hypothetical protein HRU87_02495 [Aquiluna borgnonia]